MIEAKACWRIRLRQSSLSRTGLRNCGLLAIKSAVIRGISRCCLLIFWCENCPAFEKRELTRFNLIEQKGKNKIDRKATRTSILQEASQFYITIATYFAKLES